MLVVPFMLYPKPLHTEHDEISSTVGNDVSKRTGRNRTDLKLVSDAALELSNEQVITLYVIFYEESFIQRGVGDASISS